MARLTSPHPAFTPPEDRPAATRPIKRPVRKPRKAVPSITVDGQKRRVQTESHSYDFKQRNNLKRGR